MFNILCSVSQQHFIETARISGTIEPYHEALANSSLDSSSSLSCSLLVRDSSSFVSKHLIRGLLLKNLLYHSRVVCRLFPLPVCSLKVGSSTKHGSRWLLLPSGALMSLESSLLGTFDPGKLSRSWANSLATQRGVWSFKAIWLVLTWPVIRRVRIPFEYASVNLSNDRVLRWNFFWVDLRIWSSLWQGWCGVEKGCTLSIVNVTCFLLASLPHVSWTGSHVYISSKPPLNVWTHSLTEASIRNDITNSHAI
jgi:hypothetical protein